MNIGRNEVADFQLATTLQLATASNLVSPYSTASGGLVRRVKVTDIKASCGGTARTIRFTGEGGNNKDLLLDLPADSVTDLSWEMPYALTAVSSTGETRAIYGSASGAGVRVIVTGYIDIF